ncbi:MAG: twin-arginine translocase subunit TatC [Dehalococcoidia bacterium]
MALQPNTSQRPDIVPVAPRDDMTLLEHLLELRNRVIVVAIAVIIGVAVCAFFWDVILGWLLAPARADHPELRVVSFTPIDKIGIVFKIAMYGGLILSSPVIVYEILAFVIPGLTPKERKLLLPAMFGVIFFLLAGMAFSYWVILPASLGFLIGFGDEQFETLLGAKAYIDFVTRLIFFVGLSFEMPMVLLLLGRLGVVTARQLLGFWRYAIVLIAVLAAVVTPTPDALTMALVMAPLFALYFVGILFAWIFGKPRSQPVVA